MAKSTQPAPRNEKSAQARKQAQAQVNAEKRRTTMLWVLVAAIVIGIFAVLVAFIVRQGTVSEPDGEGQLTPTVTTADDGIPVGQGGVVGEALDPERVQLVIYYDFMCPVCGKFEEINGTEIQAMSQEGLIDVIYHPISILDHTSQGTQYSTRSASTAVLIAEEAPENFAAFQIAMFASQPQEGTTGLNDKQIQDIATSVGVPDDVVAKIPTYAYAQWITGATERSSIAGVTGTPTVRVNGVDIGGEIWSVPGALRATVEAEAGN